MSYGGGGGVVDIVGLLWLKLMVDREELGLRFNGFLLFAVRCEMFVLLFLEIS